ncbi:MAG: hypothetical protein AB1744_05225 [Candidatus Zixiibacteriota bacterium]
MKRKAAIMLIVIAFVVSGAVTPAEADWWPGDDHKMHFPQTPKPGGWDVEFAMSSLGDDWMCSETGPVWDIHFWISWMGDNVQPIEAIKITIWSNNPEGPYGYSEPLEPLWGRTFVAGEFTIVEWEPDLQGWYDPSSGEWGLEDHVRRFQINIEHISDPFIQEEGTIYWLVIDFGALPFVGWKETDQHWNDDAVFWRQDMQMWQELRDPIEQTSIDLAFVITDDCCNHDGIRGNVDGIVGPGGPIDVADLTYLVAYLFQGGPAPAPCP